MVKGGNVMNYGKKNASKRQKEITSKSTMQKKKIGSRLFKSFVICILLIGIAGIAGVSYLIKSVTVSYTHLDVYKRQHYNSGIRRS